MPEISILGVFQLCFIFPLLSLTVNGGGLAAKKAWVSMGLDQRHSHLVQAHLALGKVMKRGCVHVCEVRNAVKDPSPINPCS